MNIRNFLFALLFIAPIATANPIQNLNEVGSAKLKVLLWNIYESALYTPSGNFRGIEPGLALELEYRRNIPKSEFVKYARDEWKKQSLYNNRSEEWLSRISDILPSVRKGDVIVLKVNNQRESEFYLNDQFIGKLGGENFTDRFLSIWLSTNTSYPKLRNKLVGA
ncbi:MAG: chalcone isomerase family protein [Pseudohongiellaceae bacterium]